MAMKNFSLSIFTFLLMCRCAISQEYRFGVSLGASLNHASYKEATPVDRRYHGGFDGGLLVELPVRSRFTVQPELNYTITGVELNDGDFRRSLKLQYLTIPILAKFKIIPRLSLLAGPQHGILLSAWNDPAGAVSERIKHLFKFSDLVLVGGIEYRTGDHVFFTVRYNYGLEQIGEDELGFEMKNRYVGFRIGYLF
jgi:hypothetical protein